MQRKYEAIDSAYSTWLRCQLHILKMLIVKISSPHKGLILFMIFFLCTYGKLDTILNLEINKINTLGESVI